MAPKIQDLISKSEPLPCMVNSQKVLSLESSLILDLNMEATLGIAVSIFHAPSKDGKSRVPIAVFHGDKYEVGNFSLALMTILDVVPRVEIVDENSRWLPCMLDYVRKFSKFDICRAEFSDSHSLPSNGEDADWEKHVDEVAEIEGCPYNEHCPDCGDRPCPRYAMESTDDSEAKDAPSTAR